MDGMNDDISREESIRAIMFMFAILHYGGEPIKKTLLLSIRHLKELYEQTGNEQFLDVAALELLAYMNMGFSVPQDRNIDYIMYSRNIRVTAQKDRMGKKVRLNKTQIRALIGRWMPSRLTPMTVNQVVEDIIRKVSERQIGTWQYAYRRSDSANDRIWEEERYELVITEDESFFWDLKNFRFYILEEGKRDKNGSDSDSG